MIEDCTALILAGGESRRMGQDKASLLLNGQTLLDHVTTAMHSLFPKVIVSVRRLREDIVTQQVSDERDEPEVRGPLAGLISGMAQVDTTWIFAVACDMPFIKVGLVTQLAKYRTGGVGQNAPQAVVPLIDGYPQPLAAFYATRILADMRNSLATGDHSIRGAFKNLNVRYVREDELRKSDQQLSSFFDLDTPNDLAQAEIMKENNK
jgi:molybdopterin-guanine dinucleotide biosynthesis protein A